jgi:hypothetical protein
MQTYLLICLTSRTLIFAATYVFIDSFVLRIHRFGGTRGYPATSHTDKSYPYLVESSTSSGSIDSSANFKYCRRVA